MNVIEGTDESETEKIYLDRCHLTERRGVMYVIGTRKPFTGTVVSSPPNGKKMEIECTNGRPNGKARIWYKNGQMQSELEFRDGEKSGWMTIWYENGRKKSEGDQQNAKRIGKHTTWYKNGQKASEIEYRDDKLEGKAVLWYENGQKQFEGELRSGRAVTGTVIEWDENGNLKAQPTPGQQPFPRLRSWIKKIHGMVFDVGKPKGAQQE